MKILFIAFFTTFFALATALEVTKIFEVGGPIKFIEFDSDSNVYVVSKNGEFAVRLYKLDSEKNVIWRTNINGDVQNIVINSRNDIYLFLSSGSDVSVNFIRANSTDIEELDVIPYYARALIDKEDNLIYSSGTYGIKILKRDRNISAVVNNIEDFQTYSDKTQIVDNLGNVYLGGIVWGTFDNRFIIITKEEMQEEIPQARVIEDVLQDPSSAYVEEILVNERNDIFMSTTDYLSPNTTIQKITNGRLITVLFDDEYQHHVGKPVKDRVVYASYRFFQDICKISYILPDNSFFPISNLQNVRATSCEPLLFESDGNGNIFLGSYYKIDNSTLEFLNYTESRSVGVELQGDGNVISMTMDEDNNLFVLTDSDGLFYVESGTLNVTAISNTQEMLLDAVKKNKYDGEIFLYGFTGLYVIVK